MKHDPGHTAHQQQSSVHTPLDEEHASKTASHLEVDADEASGSSVDIPAAADSLPGSTSTESSGSSSSAAAVTSHAPSSSSSSSHSSTAPGAGRSQQDVAKVLVPAAVLLAAALWLFRKARSNSTSSKKQASKHKQRQRQQAEQQEAAAAAAAAEEAAEPESTLALYASDFQLRTEDVTLVSRPAALQGLTCVISEHIPIQGATLGCGVPACWSNLPTAQSHASITHKLINKGFSIIGQGSTQPFNYPTLGSNLRNPVARFRVSGGGATGAAAAVALQQADLAVGSDWLGSVRVPAACQGLFSLVCTPGVYSIGGQGLASEQQGTADSPTQGSSSADRGSSSADRGSSSGSSGSSRRGSSGGLEGAGFIVREMSVLRRVAEHLALPGMSDLRGNLTQVVVAEDLFTLCEPEMELGLLCMKRAVLQWAGQEQAGSVQLLPFLESNCRTWTKLEAAAEANPLLSVTSGVGRPLPPVLKAITHAAQLLYHSDLTQRYSNTPAAAAADAAAAEGRDAADPQQQQQQQQEGGVGVDAVVSAVLSAGGRVRQQEREDAWQLLQEVQDLLSTAVKHDVVVVLPATPSPPPRIDAPPALQTSWLARCHAFAALTALGGCPSVVVPVGQLPQGGGPLAIGLFGHSRSDQRLLTVAERLALYAQAEFKKMEDKRAAEAAAADAADTAAAEGDRQQQGKSKQQRQQQQQVEQVDPRRLAKADKAKARGNEAFKQGKYREAIKAYSEASKLDPSNPVYLSNRALCYLRLFSFEAAEADCNAVLAFPDLGGGDRVKALLRRGTARIHKNELDGAAADFKAVLALEPNNRQAREELKAMQQQQREMQEEQRRALANRISSTAAAAAAVAPNSSSNGSLPFMPHNLYSSSGPDHPHSSSDPLFNDPVAAAAAAAAAGELTPQEFEAMRAMLQSGSLPVVLGDEGRPVVGPQGEPVIVGPGGQQMTVGPSGGVAPYRTRKKRASGS